MTQSHTAKSMTQGEAGLVLVFSISAFLCLFATAKALDTAFAFHAALASAASLWAVIAIGNRYFARPASLPPQEINGRPNYNMGPVKFSAVMSVIWGIAGFAVGLLIASQLAALFVRLAEAHINVRRRMSCGVVEHLLDVRFGEFAGVDGHRPGGGGVRGVSTTWEPDGMTS